MKYRIEIGTRHGTCIYVGSSNTLRKHIIGAMESQLWGDDVLEGLETLSNLILHRGEWATYETKMQFITVSREV